MVLGLGLLLRLAFAIPLAVALLGCQYTLLLALEGGALDERAPLVAAALFATAELAYWSLELRGPVADEPGTYLRRVALVGLMAVGVVVLGFGLLAAGELAGRGGAALDLLGVAAAVAVLALLARAAREQRPG